MLSVSTSYVEGQTGVFRLRTPSETIYLVDENEKTGRMWFRKLYEQSPHAAKKTFDQLSNAGHTPWSAHDALMEQQYAEERANTKVGTTSEGRKGMLLSGLQKVAESKFTDDGRNVR